MYAERKNRTAMWPERTGNNLVENFPVADINSRHPFYTDRVESRNQPKNEENF